MIIYSPTLNDDPNILSDDFLRHREDERNAILIKVLFHLFENNQQIEPSLVLFTPTLYYLPSYSK